MCHIRGQEGQCSSEEPTPSDGEAREVSLGHVDGTLLAEATL